ncbi:hypothetical protein QFC19_001138 [Naganishia cerealis]|uniref:Uncharacterized protein n=1 Tax=Naganishia cerealis TaxID=610337 RepID=A0ACC2WHY3_9TREE|nr:hypothetical protein QFC19_001138 [Naganishia cerealis]
MNLTDHDISFRLFVPGTSHAITFGHYERKPSALSETSSQSGKLTRKLRYALAGLLGVILIVFFSSTRSTEHEHRTSHALTEEEYSGGYFAEDGSFLADLGPEGENVYNLGITDSEEYLKEIKSFVNRAFPVRYRKKLERSIDLYFPADPQRTEAPEATPKGILNFKFIHQTDKNEDGGEMSQAWRDLNQPEGWKYAFYDDERADIWISRLLRNSEVAWAWQSLRRGVLKADFFRYLVVLMQGGVYSDVDTKPLKPINSWGNDGLHLHDISSTDGPAWWTKIAAQPSVVIGIDVDVHEFVGWEKDYIKEIPEQVARLEESKPPNWKKQIRTLKSKMDSGNGILPVMEHTGPGIWTDAVLAYLKARYNVTWHDLRGLQHPQRIGEVMILPITAFSPGGEPDFRAKGQDDPQAAVYHDFRDKGRNTRLAKDYTSLCFLIPPDILGRSYLQPGKRRPSLFVKDEPAPTHLSALEKRYHEAHVRLWTSDKAGYSDDAPDITRLTIAGPTQVDDDQARDYALPQGMAATYFSGEFKTTGEEFATGLGDDCDKSETPPTGPMQHFNPLESLKPTSRLGHAIPPGTPASDPLIMDNVTSGHPVSNYPALAPTQSYHDNDADYRYNQLHDGSEHNNSGSGSESSSDSESGADSQESSKEQQSGDEDDYGEGEEGDGFLNGLQAEGREQIIKQIDERLGEDYGEFAEDLFQGEKAPTLLSGVPS